MHGKADWRIGSIHTPLSGINYMKTSPRWQTLQNTIQSQCRMLENYMKEVQVRLPWVNGMNQSVTALDYGHSSRPNRNE
jgi:hypothetical protein